MIEYTPMFGPALDELRDKLTGPIQAIPTPWDSWNRVCRMFGGQKGFALGWHVLIAGKSGGGKTFTSQNIAAAAMRAGEAVTIHSLEMSREALALRILAIISGEKAWKLQPGPHFCADTYDRARMAMDECKGSLYVNNRPMHRLVDVADGMRSNFEKHGCRLHIVDYLQLAGVEGIDNRYERITTVSHTVRNVAYELDLVSVGLSQLNRDGIKAGKPSKEAMDGGGPLEADADQVMLLDHSRMQPVVNSEGRNRGWIGWAVLDKNRHGEGADIPIRFDSDTFRIRERLPDEILPGEAQR